jgi:hypothetical protein
MEESVWNNIRRRFLKKSESNLFLGYVEVSIFYLFELADVIISIKCIF